MSGSHSRTKGHSFERQIAQDFRIAGWHDAARHLEYQSSEAYGVDLIGTDPFLVQCKRGKSYAPISAIEEIQTNNGIRLLVTKADRKPAMAVLPWNDFLHLIQRT